MSGRLGRTLPRTPERVISSSSSASSSSSSAVSLPGRVGLVALVLGLGAVRDPGALHVVRLVGGDHGLGLQVPALAALGGPQRLGPLGAGRADGGEGVPAGDEHLLDLAGVQVGAAELDGADAAAVLGGQVADDIAGQRHGQPLRPWSGVGSFSLQFRRGRSGRVGCRGRWRAR